MIFHHSIRKLKSYNKINFLSPGKLKCLQINSTPAAQFQVVDTSDVLAAVRTKRDALGKLVSSWKGRFRKGLKNNNNNKENKY